MKHRQTIHIRFSDGTTGQLPVTTTKRIAFVSLGWDEGYHSPDAREMVPKVKQSQITKSDSDR